MARKSNDDGQRLTTPLMMYQQFVNSFQEMKWTLPVSGAFDLDPYLKTMMAEAGMTGQSVVIMASIVPTEMLYGGPEGESEDAVEGSEVQSAEGAGGGVGESDGQDA
jgi:hypothetical protein